MPKPYIVIECGVPRLSDHLPQVRANRLGVIGRFWEHMHAFDENNEYRISVPKTPQIGWFARVLAYTIYNPTVPVTCEWTKCGEYKPQSIVDLVSAGLEGDDDVITQWFSGQDVIRLLQAGDTFSRMACAVNCICGAHEVSDEARSFVERVLGTAVLSGK